MYKVAVIGARARVLPFLAVGFTVLEAEDADTARGLLRRAADSGEYAVIYIESAFASALSAEIAKYKDKPVPAISVLPA